VRVKHEKLILLILLFTAACIVLWYWGSLHFFDRWRIARSGGAAGLHEEAGFAFWNFSVKPTNGVAEIIRQTSNFVHRDNDNHANLLIGCLSST